MTERRFFFKLFDHMFVQTFCIKFVQYIICFPLDSYNSYHSPNNVSIPFELKSAIAWDSSRFSHVTFVQSTIFPVIPASRDVREVKTRCHIAVLLLHYVHMWVTILFTCWQETRCIAPRRSARSSQASSERCLVATWKTMPVNRQIP